MFESRADLFTGERRYVLKDNPDTALVFASFSCPRNGLPGARGYWSVLAGPLGSGNSRVEHYGALEPSDQADTNQRAALQALIEALGLEPWRSLGFKRIIIAMSSEYTVLGLAERVEGWKARGWKLSSGRPTANVDLWTQVLARVEFWERFGVEILMWEVKKGVNRDANGLLRHAEARYGPHYAY
ncbi:hypothetical protein BDY24DRAFT_18325 [Mrakia frigida]|uniref:uncharacterized protein n=1 Tax=Mrakia frigida TaxID=29902 RepID=UPI003FCC207D